MILKAIAIFLFILGGIGDLTEREPAKGYITAFNGRMNSLLNHARTINAKSIFQSLGVFILKWAGLVFFSGIILIYAPFYPIKVIAKVLLYLSLFAAIFAISVPYVIDWKLAAMKDLKQWYTWLLPITPLGITLLIGLTNSADQQATWSQWSQTISLFTSSNLSLTTAILISIGWLVAIASVTILSLRFFALITVYPALIITKIVSIYLNVIYKYITPNLYKSVLFTAAIVLMVWQ